MNCHTQTPETIQLKSKVMKKLYEFEQKHLGRDNTGSLNLRADRTQQIKQVGLVSNREDPLGSAGKSRDGQDCHRCG